MGLHGAVIDAGLSPGDRTGGLAKAIGEAKGGNTPNLSDGVSKLLDEKMKQLMCWDAALLCAWAANGIDCQDIDMVKKAFGVVQANDCSRVFGPDPRQNPLRVVNTAADLRALPNGAFIGFINNHTKFLRHMMLHIGAGQGAGTKNSCIFSGCGDVGFETLDMTRFFGADAGAGANPVTTMVYMPITGQIV